MYDLAATIDPADEGAVRAAMHGMRAQVDASSAALRTRGQLALDGLHRAYAHRGMGRREHDELDEARGLEALDGVSMPYAQFAGLRAGQPQRQDPGLAAFGMLMRPVPYAVFKRRLAATRPDEAERS